MQFRVFPSVVTTTDKWRERIGEAERLHITDLSFFPTCLNATERQEAYELLEKYGIKRIPHVHLRSDMTPDEIRLLRDKFETQKFNIHSPLDLRYVPEHDLSEFRHLIYVENSTFPWKESLRDWAGICLDVTHLEAEKLSEGEVVSDWQSNLEIYPVGIWHVSAIYLPKKWDHINQKPMHDVHTFDSLERFAYVKKYRKYIPDIISLELENGLEEQLQVCDYLQRALG